jgi:hypothetical protein
MLLDTSDAADDATALCASSTGAADLVYRLVLSEGADLELTLASESVFDALLYVRAGECENPLAEIACANWAPAGGTEFLRLSLPPGSYFIFVDGVGAGDRGVAELAVGEVLPVFPATWGQLKARTYP